MNDQIPNESTPLPQETFRMVGNTAELFAALAKAQAAFGPIVKNRTVNVRSDKGAYTFDYATLDVVLDACRPALNAAGLALIQPFSAEGDGCELRTMLLHQSGAFIELTYRFPKPSRIQELGSVLTYIRRYSGSSLLGVSSEEDDDGNAADGNQASGRPRGNPPPPPAKASSKPQERQPAKVQAPKAEPAQAPVVVSSDPLPPSVGAFVVPTNEDMSTTVVDDVNGPDGEAMDDDRPEFRDPSPASDETKKLIQATQTKLLSLNGTGKDIALPLRIAILKRAAGIEATPGQKIALTEGEGQRIVAFLYEVASDLKIDPDGMVSQAEVKMAVKAFEKRVGLVS